jgi:hypothetical protein
MATRTQPHAAFSDTLQSSLGTLVERAASAAPGVERTRLVRWLLVGLAVFALWRLGRGLKKAFWTTFGIAMVLWWTGGFGFLLR